MSKFVYIGDPMCSWCYGFGPEIQRFLLTQPEAELDIVVGGLRAYNRQVMDEGQRDMILTHWKKVAQISGLPFDMAGLDRQGFVYDTEPVCRAVVTAKILAEDMPSMAILEVFLALQRAFYAEACDVTDEAVLAQVASEALNAFDGTDSFDVASFYETLTSPPSRDETRQHFEQVQRWGVRGYPVLLAVKEDGLHMLSSGYANAETLQAAYQQLAD